MRPPPPRSVLWCIDVTDVSPPESRSKQNAPLCTHARRAVLRTILVLSLNCTDYGIR